jgi:peptidoglycan/LPS O-acetylase OafA/YrhL
MYQTLPMVSSEQHTGEIPSIQYLRGIAAVAVVYFHTGVNSANLAWPSYMPRDFGKAGVDIFFVISGFIMMFVTSTRETSPRDFLLRRIIRIVPLYWFFTLLVILDGLIYPAAMLNNAIVWPHIFLSLLFIPHINPITGSTEPFFKLGWTLIYEMYFYAVFALLLLVRPISRRMILMVLWAAGAALVFALTKPLQAIPLVYTNPIILEFVLGALIGFAYLNGYLRRFSPTFGWLLVLLSAAVIIFTPFPDDSEFMYRSIMRPVIYGIPAAMIVFGLLSVDSSGKLQRLPWLMLIGDASYSIYLSHTTTLTMFRVISRVLHVPVQIPIIGAALVGAALICAILLGIVVFRYVELPLMSWLKTLIRRHRLAAATP